MIFPTNIDLEPCPFCNEKDNLWIDVFNADFSYTEYCANIQCKNCNVIKNVKGTYFSKEVAIIAARDDWNKSLRQIRNYGKRID